MKHGKDRRERTCPERHLLYFHARRWWPRQRWRKIRRGLRTGITGMPSARAMPCKNAPRLLPRGRDGHTSRAAASVGCVGLFTPRANRATRRVRSSSRVRTIASELAVAAYAKTKNEGSARAHSLGEGCLPFPGARGDVLLVAPKYLRASLQSMRSRRRAGCDRFRIRRCDRTAHHACVRSMMRLRLDNPMLRHTHE